MRGAEAGDLAALAAILGGWCRDTAWLPKLHTPADDLWFLGKLRDRGTLRVAGPCWGFLARRGGEVDALYLAPKARRKGIGRVLMAKALAEWLALRTFAASRQARVFDAPGFGRAGDTDAGLPDLRPEGRRHGAAY